MNFKETFLKLTEYTTPFQTESDLEPILLSMVSGLKRDTIGNYHKVIGNSETLFTCHLDNFCKTKEKVNHVIENNIIRTDETTILGADNKIGVCVLLYLISNNVPGHYCFFVGEEPILSGGCYGSLLFSRFKSITKFKRAIAFDRKETASIVTRQMAQECCSSKFSNELATRFIENMIWSESDPTGYYTDTASFLELIPECTNISVGVYNEHTKKEYVDIEYAEKVAVAASKINWETLPTVREPKCWLENEEEVEEIETSEKDKKLFEVVSTMLDNLNFVCMNKNSYNFNRVMIFNHWFKEFKLEVTVRGGYVKIFDYSLPVGYRLSIYKEDLMEIITYCKEDMLEDMLEEMEENEI